MDILGVLLADCSSYLRTTSMEMCKVIFFFLQILMMPKNEEKFNFECRPAS